MCEFNTPKLQKKSEIVRISNGMKKGQLFLQGFGPECKTRQYRINKEHVVRHLWLKWDRLPFWELRARWWFWKLMTYQAGATKTCTGAKFLRYLSRQLSSLSAPSSNLHESRLLQPNAVNLNAGNATWILGFLVHLTTRIISLSSKYSNENIKFEVKNN